MSSRWPANQAHCREGYVPQVAGGGEFISSITVANPSTTASVTGIIDTFQSLGGAMSSAYVDPNISFLIPPGGTTTVNLHNKGSLVTGFVRVYSSAAVSLTVAYNSPEIGKSRNVPAGGFRRSVPFSDPESWTIGMGGIGDEFPVRAIDD